MRNCKFVKPVFRALLLGCFFLPFGLYAQNSLTRLAGEYRLIGSLPGDQVAAAASFDQNGGWVVWHDNSTDGDGTGIGARHLNGSLSGDLSAFRVNEIASGDQENPRVTRLQDGGAVFVWQGGRSGFPRIFARFMTQDGVFRTGDIMVNTYTNGHQLLPQSAVLSNGNVAIAWSSYGQDGSLYGAYGRIYSPEGSAITGEFRINENGLFNQQVSSIVGLANGNFVVTWTSEIQATGNSAGMEVAVFGRVLDSSGVALDGGQFRLTQAASCEDAAVVATESGFMAAWAQRDLFSAGDNWDIFYRLFDGTGVGLGSAVRVNTTSFGDQFFPSIAVAEGTALIVWTSMAQDGSQEGVYGRYVNAAGQLAGEEIRINTTAASQQIMPTVSSDGNGRFLVSWSSFVGVSLGFDLYGQRFAVGTPTGLLEPSAPFVFPLDATTLSVTWPEMGGYPVAFYEIHKDEQSNSPIVVNGIQTTVTGLSPGSTHSFRILYQLTDGQRSSLSPASSGTTWGSDGNSDGLPDNWQSAHWGVDMNQWPSAQADFDGDGASNFHEFLAGTDPGNASSVLRTRLGKTVNGFTFSWNTKPGFVYQIQKATDLGSWESLGLARLAHGTTDAINVEVAGQSIFYRVIRLR